MILCWMLVRERECERVLLCSYNIICNNNKNSDYKVKQKLL